MQHFAAEKLSPEGKALIARMYEDGERLSDILTELRSATGEELALSSLHRYCVKIIAVEIKRRQAIKARARAMIELAKEDPNCTEAEIANGLVYQALLENQNNIHELDLPLLLQEQRRRESDRMRADIEKEKIAVDRERISIEKLALDLKRDLAAKAKEAVAGIPANKLSETGGDPAKVRQAVEEAIAEKLGLNV